MKNIYFVGKAGAGKTYACNYLKEKYNYKQAKFAYPVYGIARDYFEMKNKDRKLLQTIGTDIAREKIHQDIWIDRFRQDIFIVEATSMQMGFDLPQFVSDDCRFENEHKLLKSMGWVGIYLDVTDDIRIKRLGNRDGNAQIETLNHSSETSLDNFKNDLIKIDSSGTLQQTYNQLNEFMKVANNNQNISL